MKKTNSFKWLLTLFFALLLFASEAQNIRHDQLQAPQSETSDSIVFYMHDAQGYWRLGKGVLDTSMVRYIEAYATIQRLNDSVAVLRGEIPTLLTELDSAGFNVDYSQLTNVPAFLISETDPTFNAHLASDITATDTTWWGQQPTYLTDLDSTWFDIDTSQVRDLQTFVQNNSAEVSGTEGYIPKFGVSGLTESVVFEAATGNVGIGKTNPTEKLDVNGNIKGDTVKAVLDTIYADKTSWSEFVGGSDLWNDSGDTISPKSYPVRIDTMIMGETSDIIPSYAYYQSGATKYRDSVGTVTTTNVMLAALSDNGKYHYTAYYSSNTIYVRRSSDYGGTHEELITINTPSSSNAIGDIECSSDGRVLAFTITYTTNNCAYVSYDYGESFATYSKSIQTGYFDVSISRDGSIIGLADYTERKLVLCKNGVFSTIDLAGNYPIQGVINSDTTYYFVNYDYKLCKYTPSSGITTIQAGLSKKPRSGKYIMKDDDDNYYYADNYSLKKTTDDFATTEIVNQSISRDVTNFVVSSNGKYIYIVYDYFYNIVMSDDYGASYTTYFSGSTSNVLWSFNINRGLYSPRVDIRYEDGRMNFIEGGISLNNYKPINGGDVVTLAYLNSVGLGSGSGDATGDITSIIAGDGLDLGGDFGDITLKLGTPSSILSTSTNSVSTTSHTHALGDNAVTYSKLNNNIISGQTAITSGLVSTDELLLSDAGVLKRMDVSVLGNYMQNNLDFGDLDLSSLTVDNTLISAADHFVYVNSSDSKSYRISPSHLGPYLSNHIQLQNLSDVPSPTANYYLRRNSTNTAYEWVAGTGSTGTDIDVVQQDYNVEIKSSTGSNDIIYSATSTKAGVMSKIDKVNLDAAYNDKINSLAVTGTTTKTITLTQQDGGTVSGTFTDLQGSGGSTAESYQTLTSSSSVTFNRTTSRNAKLTMGTNVTLTISNLVNGDIPCILRVYPNSSTNYTLTFPSAYFVNDHSNVFTIEAGSGMFYKFTFETDGTNIAIDYATYSN